MKYLIWLVGLAVMIISIFIDGIIGWAVWSLGLVTVLIPLTFNWLKGVFVHKRHDKNHFPVERYTGLTCVGYKCHGCGYEWYKKR